VSMTDPARTSVPVVPSAPQTPTRVNASKQATINVPVENESPPPDYVTLTGGRTQKSTFNAFEALYSFYKRINAETYKKYRDPHKYNKRDQISDAYTLKYTEEGNWNLLSKTGEVVYVSPKCTSGDPPPAGKWTPAIETDPIATLTYVEMQNNELTHGNHYAWYREPGDTFLDGTRQYDEYVERPDDINRHVFSARKARMPERRDIEHKLQQADLPIETRLRMMFKPQWREINHKLQQDDLPPETRENLESCLEGLKWQLELRGWNPDDEDIALRQKLASQRQSVENDYRNNRVLPKMLENFDAKQKSILADQLWTIPAANKPEEHSSDGGLD